MKRVLLWTVVTAGAGAGIVLALRWLETAREGLAHGLERAERVTAATRQSLDETERALREARGVVS